MKEIDCRGLACPAPVLHTKATLQEGRPEAVRVLVDNAASQENVRRFLESEGYETRNERSGDDYAVVGRRSGAAAAAPASETRPATATPPGERRTVLVLCTSDRIGRGDDELGRRLMVNFLKTLREMGPDLWRLVFVNNGVKLTIDSSEVLEDLKAYETGGLKILVCGTCLNHFGLLERKQVGETTNMLDIVTALQLADKVITV
ncbi:MAG: sulfurtransferase-like selenium metabolism protein YedF [Desulfobacterales bacterium]